MKERESRDDGKTGVPFGFAQGKLSTSLGMTERESRDDGKTGVPRLRSG